MRIAFVGLDLAKNVFQVHAADRDGRAIHNRRLTRGQVLRYFTALPPCVVGMEACASAHHWGRQLQQVGHTVRLMAPAFVQPYRKSGKNDANDAAAICEAVQRPSMRFVSVKTAEQQSTLVLHRLRQQQMRNRVALINQVRGLLAEFGVIVRQGPHHLRATLPELLEDASNSLPPPTRRALARMRAHLLDIEAVIQDLDSQIEQQIAIDVDAQRLLSIPGVGPLTASAAAAMVGDATAFRNGRQFAAWAGLVPRQNSSGGKQQLGSITKKGDPYLRTLLVHSARAFYVRAKTSKDPRASWVLHLAETKGAAVAIVALAAKHARIIWAMLSRQRAFDPELASACSLPPAAP
jgi:transposase